MIRFGFPTVPLLIGFILTPLLEENLRTVLLLASTYDENLLFVFTRPAFNVLIFLIAIIIALITLRKIKNRRVPPSPINK